MEAELSLTSPPSDGTTATSAAGATRASASASTSNDLPVRGGRNGANGGEEPERNRQHDHDGDDAGGGGATLRTALSPVPSATGEWTIPAASSYECMMGCSIDF